MTDLQFRYVERGMPLIFATEFFTDEMCSVAPYDDSWGLYKFKAITGYAAMSFDTVLPYQKYIDADTPYITAMTTR